MNRRVIETKVRSDSEFGEVIHLFDLFEKIKNGVHLYFQVETSRLFNIHSSFETAYSFIFSFDDCQFSWIVDLKHLIW